MSPYLILHKVRGEPAFDIAERTTIADEEAWIIPTSGHRAYPYWYHEVHELYSAPNEGTLSIRELVGRDDLPKGWPDHYACNDPQAKTLKSTGFSTLLESLGLIKPAPTITRRF